MNWLLIFLGFCVLIMLHETGHYVAAKATGMRVERFFLFFGPTIWSFKRGETEYGIKSIPAGGYVKISGMNPEEELPPGEEHRAYYRQKVWKRIVVVAAGPAVNIVLAFVILFFVFLLGSEKTNQTVGEIRPNTPAAQVLQQGDEVVAVDGFTLSGLETEQRLASFGRLVGAHACAGDQVNGCRAATPVELTIRRDGELRTISVRPEYNREAGRALVGFSYGSEGLDVSAGAAASEAWDRMWVVTSGTARVFSHIFEEEQRKQISGIVGTSDVANQVIDFGVAPALILLAIVSLSLGLINLLPILPLDGGHIFWAIVEKLRGAPVSLRVMERASIVGFALVLMLFVLGLSNDIGRITGEGFKVR
ncbi:MAG TPA: site-2 protease family protein [Solirubrobacterales bacterium]|nr:site-2 protease family protein [Solirubrobacterales bacterium]